MHRSKNISIYVTTAFLVFTLLKVDLLAQLGGGSIVGVVLDPSGSVIAGARV